MKEKEKELEDFQSRVLDWLLKCFGIEISKDILERNDRFIEESLELAQSLNYSADRAHALVDYVFGRPKGEPFQEVGGVMVTLAALCSATGLNMMMDGEVEYARINTPEIIEKIRKKQASKPTGSALPINDQSLQPDNTELLQSENTDLFYNVEQLTLQRDELQKELTELRLQPYVKQWVSEVIEKLQIHIDPRADSQYSGSEYTKGKNDGIRLAISAFENNSTTPKTDMVSREAIINILQGERIKAMKSKMIRSSADLVEGVLYDLIQEVEKL